MSSEQDPTRTDAESEPVEIAPGVFQIDNEVGGTSICVNRYGDLAKVPRSHRKMLTPSLRAIFPRPCEHFKEVAKACPFANMRKWLNKLVRNDDWLLQLHQGTPPEYTGGGFAMMHDKICSAELVPGSARTPKQLPKTMKTFHGLVEQIDWIGFGIAGGIHSSRSHQPLTQFVDPSNDLEFDPATTFGFGSAPSGDMLVYTKDDRAGWWTHECNQIHFLGTIEQTLEWIFGELLANRCPDVDYEWFQ